MEKGTECVGGWIQIRMKCPKRGHVRRNNDEIELRKWQSKTKYFIHNFLDLKYYQVELAKSRVFGEKA